MKSLNCKGSLLILSLWLFLLFGLLAASLALRSRLEIQMTRLREAQGVVPYTMLSAVNFFQAALEMDKEPETDHLSDAWYGEGFMESFFNANPPARQSIASMEVRDEESKININKAGAEVLKFFFEGIAKKEKAFSTNPEDWTAGILYWRGDSWIKKTAQTGAFYKKAPFESVDEILLVPGVKAEDLEIVRPYLTVYPSGRDNAFPFRININTAPEIVLQALFQSESGGDTMTEDLLIKKILAFRSGKLEGPEESAFPYFLSQDLTAEEFLSRLQLPQSAASLNMLSRLLLHLTADSEYFTLRLFQKIGKQKIGVETILEIKTQGGNHESEILAWQRL